MAWLLRLTYVYWELRILSEPHIVTELAFAGVKIEYLARETWFIYAVALACPLIQGSGVPAKGWAHTLTSSRVEYLGLGHLSVHCR